MFFNFMENFTSLPKIQGKSTEPIKHITQALEYHHSLLELIDNAIDAHAKKIKVSINTNTRLIEIFDNGIGFPSLDVMQYVFTNWTAHIADPNQATIGLKGAGMKFALMKLSGFERFNKGEESLAIIESANPLHHSTINWVIANREDLDGDVSFSSREVNGESFTRFVLKLHDSIYLPNFIEKIKEDILKRYVSDDYKVSLTIDDVEETLEQLEISRCSEILKNESLWTDVTFKCPKYHITTCGFYKLEKLIFPNGNSTRSVTVCLWGGEDKDKVYDRVSDKGYSHSSGGVYLKRGNKILGVGGTENLIENIGSNKNRGGQGNIRKLIEIDNDSIAQYFNINTQKATSKFAIYTDPVLNPHRARIESGEKRVSTKIFNQIDIESNVWAQIFLSWNELGHFYNDVLQGMNVKQLQYFKSLVCDVNPSIKDIKELRNYVMSIEELKDVKQNKIEKEKKNIPIAVTIEDSPQVFDSFLDSNTNDEFNRAFNEGFNYGLTNLINKMMEMNIQNIDEVMSAISTIIEENMNNAMAVTVA